MIHDVIYEIFSGICNIQHNILGLLYEWSNSTLNMRVFQQNPFCKFQGQFFPSYCASMLPLFD